MDLLLLSDSKTSIYDGSVKVRVGQIQMVGPEGDNMSLVTSMSLGMQHTFVGWFSL